MLSRITTLILLTGFALASVSAFAQDGRRFYRYENDEGVKVMNSTIPPKYVKKGYEIVSPSDHVLEVVPPAPTEEEKAAKEAEAKRQAELEEWDTRLLRRYSTLEDIEKAKQRKIEDFEASLSILRGNVASIEAQIEEMQGRAANIERQGGKVPDNILESLDTLKAEREETQALIDKRLENQAAMEEQFDQDMERFEVIRPRTLKDPQAQEARGE